MSTIWVYKLVCSNEECRHEEITDYFDKECPVCGCKYIVVEKWPGGR